jgi:hypothetical protein
MPRGFGFGEKYAYKLGKSLGRKRRRKKSDNSLGALVFVVIAIIVIARCMGG